MANRNVRSRHNPGGIVISITSSNAPESDSGRTGWSSSILKFGGKRRFLIRAQSKGDHINRYSRILTLVLIPIGREKFDTIPFARRLINLPPTDVRHMNPISMSQLQRAKNIFTHSDAITGI